MDLGGKMEDHPPEIIQSIPDPVENKNEQLNNALDHLDEPDAVPNEPANEPEGWDDELWMDGDAGLQDWMDPFSMESEILVNIPEDANELYFFALFLPYELLQNIVDETNRYAGSYIDSLKAGDNLRPKSRFNLWPEEGIDLDVLKQFIALTFQFGLVKKENLKTYWSLDVLSPPFPSLQ